MADTIFTCIETNAKALKLDLNAEAMARIATENSFSEAQLDAISRTLEQLKIAKETTVVQSLLRMSRLPMKSPKTFDNFKFERLHGRDADSLKDLTTLSALYTHESLAFIGPPGVGKTHLAMAYGRACCEHSMKAYYLTANELNQKLTTARNLGHEARAITSLVKPTCLIIDEIGRCVFDKANTRMFFDLIDRRYNKDCLHTTIFTSNKQPDQWQEYFSEDDTLLCTLDRIFDKAVVYMFKGESYRGGGLKTIGLDVSSQANRTSEH